VANGVVYMGSEDRNVYAFSFASAAEIVPKPSLGSVRPDFSLKVSWPVTTPIDPGA
jgi:hypothetical protein